MFTIKEDVGGRGRFPTKSERWLIRVERVVNKVDHEDMMQMWAS